MAVPIDTVYQRVLALANKEQRGYITPQEFNLFANQAQMAIYETYFYEKDKAAFEDSIKGNDTGADMIHMIDEKLKYFYISGTTAGSGANLTTHYRLDKVFYTHNGGSWLCQEVSIDELHAALSGANQPNTPNMIGSNLLQPFATRPIYHRNSLSTISVYTSTSSSPVTSGVTYSYWRIPIEAKWGYTVVNYEALYDATQTTDFSLHPSEESNLVIKILELAGITLNKPGLIQVANQEEAEVLQMKNS